MKRILLLTSLAICVSCDNQKTNTFNTQDFNLKYDIKHITEKTGDHTWDFEFQDNRLLSVKENLPGTRNDSNYHLEYHEGNLVQIYNGFYEISPEIFLSNINMRLPLYGFHNADSLVRNDFGDVVKVLFKDATPNEYRIEYTYDPYDNWIVRELFIGQTKSFKERTDRTILYHREVSNKEIASWNTNLDSIYILARERNQLILSIDETIEKDHSKLNKLNDFLNKNYDDVKSTEADVETLMIEFDKEYGQENLSVELEVIKNKLTILRGITLRKGFLWFEARAYIPLLISGKKSVKDLQEPFTERYILTYSLELIDDINKLNKEYNNQ